MNQEFQNLTNYNLVIHSPPDDDFVIRHNGAEESKFRKDELAGGHGLRGDESKARPPSSDLGTEKFDQIWPSLTKLNQFYSISLMYWEGDEKPTNSRAGSAFCAAIAEGRGAYESSNTYHNSHYLTDQRLRARAGQIQGNRK